MTKQTNHLEENCEMPQLDYSKLRFADKPISSAEALADVIPIPWNKTNHEKKGE